jgi:hypothetical protein
MTLKATSKTTSKMAAKAARKNSVEQSRKQHSARKPNRINRQRRLQKQLQILLLERHSRRCIICHHPEREAIEEEFVHWRAPWKLAQDYKLDDYRTVYRHARAAGLLLQRRERLHSALDAFVESVDDVTFTGDTILRAMRAYTCIDSQGRWTEIPTRVQISTFHDDDPPTTPPSGGRRSSARISNVEPNVSSNIVSDIIDIEPDEASEEDALEKLVKSLSASKKSMLRDGAIACAASPAQAVDVAEDEYADPETDDDSDLDQEDDPENDDDPEDDPDDDPDDDKNPKNKSHVDSLEETTACAAPPAQTASGVRLNSKDHGRTVTATTRSTSSKFTSRSDTTACAALPAQALPRDVVRGQNPNDRSPSDRTDCAAPAQNAARHVAQPNRSPLQQQTGRAATATTCAASPAQALPRDLVRGQNPNDRSPSDRTDCAAVPAQPAIPQKPKPDADGIIWHPRPGYPDQEISEPDDQGRVAYKIHITPPASQLPSRETDARRAADLIYRSVIKKYGNP